MVFTGQQPAREIPAFVQACDILVSPRRRGTNTPLKIYSYLRSGKPIVATDLLTHTQVLSPAVARLVPAEAKAFAAGVGRARRSTRRNARGWRARRRRWPPSKYSREAYVRRTAQAYAASVRCDGSRAQARVRKRVRARSWHGPTVNVLVTGATGFTGGHLAAGFGAARVTQVRALVRPRSLEQVSRIAARRSSASRRSKAI